MSPSFIRCLCIHLSGIEIQDFIWGLGSSPPPPPFPPQNLEVDIFFILSSSLAANFQPFWSPRSHQMQPHSVKISIIFWGSIPSYPLGDVTLHTSFSPPPPSGWITNFSNHRMWTCSYVGMWVIREHTNASNAVKK